MKNIFWQRKFILCFAFAAFNLFFNQSKAQSVFNLHIVAADKDSSFFEKNFSYQKIFNDSFSRAREVKNLFTKLYKNSFLFAQDDSEKVDSNLLTVFIRIGKVCEWSELKNGNVPVALLDKIGFREKLYSNKKFSAKEISSLCENMLDYAENNGFPFAKVKLDSFKISDEKISASVFYFPNNLIFIDSIDVSGNVKISKTFLYNYIGVSPNSRYNEDAIRKISSRLLELPYLSESKPFHIVFNGNSASIHLFLKKKNASRFDFVLGVLPNNLTNGKVLLTGEGTLHLQNSLGKGEQFNLNFNKYQKQTTTLKAKFQYPYLFSQPFGVDFNFELYKHDTSWLDLKRDAGISYLFSHNNHIEAFINNQTSFLLSFDSSRIISTKQLPPNIDIGKTFYGLNYVNNNLDYIYNPRNGNDFSISASIGKRKVKKNLQITELHDPLNPNYDFNVLYDSLKLNSVQYKFELNAAHYFPIAKRSTIKTSLASSALIAQNIFQNELLRIGGYHLLRGFDEESVPCTLYAVGTAEYHYLLSQNSYFYGFFDYAYIMNQSIGKDISDTPFGFGVGMTFETKAGVFGVSYALGSQQNNPIDLRSAKIHFGYINYF